jgi:dimethylargininase
VRLAITRAVSPTISRCELSFIERRPIDASRAAAQHEVYERRLEARGCKVVRVTEASDMPDGVFVEDAAVVLDDVAIITRPGAASRRGEIESIAEVLQQFRPLLRIAPPATLDGGDVLRLGRRLYIGLSQRTNQDALAQLRNFDVVPVRFSDCLHLKSAVTQIDDGTLLLNPEWVDPKQFPGFEHVAVDPTEPWAANALPVGDYILYSASHPRTCRALEIRGYRVERIDVSELEKAEAGVTCCSLIFEANPERGRV